MTHRPRASARWQRAPLGRRTGRCGDMPRSLAGRGSYGTDRQLPADGATLTTPPAEVLLEFSEAVQAEFGQVAVLDDADVHHEQGNPQIVGATVTQGVDESSAGTLPDLVPRRVSGRTSDHGNTDVHGHRRRRNHPAGCPAHHTDTGGHVRRSARRHESR